MPIPISCPHCQKLYRLKDELAGKTVKCQNPDCRKPFPVPVPKTAAEVEADALKAFADEADLPTDQRVIPLTCEMCSHQWEVPWAMQGKNVLCPECRHRNKVPMQKQAKAADWKTGGGKPSMARVEELEGVVASTDQSRVSGEALRKGGAVVDVYEARPASFWLLFVGLPVLLAAGLVYLGSSFFRGKSDKREANYMAEALRDQEEAKDTQVPAPEQPLFRGALAVAAGEYLGRLDDPAKLTEAVKQFARARQELDGAGASVGRTLLLGELAVAQVGLGGSDDQATAGTRLRWAPGSGRQKLNEKQYTVQTELADTLAALNRPDKLVSLPERQAIARRLVRRAVELGQPTALDPVIPKLFTDAEAADGQALAAVEGLKAGGDADLAKKRAEELAPLAAGGSGPYLQALVATVGPVPGLVAPNPPGSQVPSDTVRQAWTAAHLLAKRPGEALELARRGTDPTTRGSRCLALALAAEWADDPKPAVEAAAEVMAEPAQNAARIPDPTLVRLAGAAGRAGLADKAEAFVKAVDKPDARAWAQAEATRGRLLASPTQPADEAAIKVPDEAKDYRSGLAWQLLWAARQTARASRSADAAAGYDRWGTGLFRPFGYAGLALGLQDSKLK